MFWKSKKKLDTTINIYLKSGSVLTFKVDGSAFTTFKSGNELTKLVWGAMWPCIQYINLDQVEAVIINKHK